MAKSRIAQRRAQARVEGSKRYQARRAALIAAAGKVFAENGYQAASIYEIATLANIDRASLYYYVGSKKELFFEVFEGYIQFNAETAEVILASDASPRQKLKDLILQLIASYETHYPSLFAFIQEDLAKIFDAKTGAGREIQGSLLRFNEITVEIIESGIKTGDFRPDVPPKVAAYSVIGMVNSTHRWFRPGAGLSGQELGTLLAQIVCDGLGAGDTK